MLTEDTRLGLIIPCEVLTKLQRSGVSIWLCLFFYWLYRFLWFFRDRLCARVKTVEKVIEIVTKTVSNKDNVIPQSNLMLG